MKLDKKFRFDRGHVVTHINEAGEENQIHFRPSWPPVLIHVHPQDKYGAEFCVIPKMGNNDIDTRIL